jgi:hypothetical protein
MDVKIVKIQREENSLEIYENRIQMGIFGCTKGKNNERIDKIT